METLTITPFAFNMKPSYMPLMPPAATMMMVNHPNNAHTPQRSELLCRYPSKLCDNIRSEKRGGGLHRFCAFHRERANINQRRVDHRRRLRRRGAVVSPTERTRDRDVHSADEDNGLEEEMVSLEIDSFPFDQSEPLCTALSEDDLQVLIALLDEPTTPESSFKEERENEPSAWAAPRV